MSRVNLLPQDIKQGQEVRRRTVLVLIGAAVVIGLIILLWVFQGVRLNGVNDDIEAQNQTNAGLQQEIADLQKYEDLQAEAQQQEQLLGAAYADEVAYSSILVDVSKVIPPDTYLTSFSSNIDTTAVPSSDPAATDVRGHDDVLGIHAALRLPEHVAHQTRERAGLGQPLDIEHLAGRAQSPGRSPSTPPST